MYSGSFQSVDPVSGLRSELEQCRSSEDLRLCASAGKVLKEDEGQSTNESG